MSHQRFFWFQTLGPICQEGQAAPRMGSGFLGPTLVKGKIQGKSAWQHTMLMTGWCVDVDVKPGGNTRTVYMGKCIKVLVLDPYK